MNDAIRIGSYLPWGLAGLVLGKSLVPKGGTSSRPGKSPNPCQPKTTSLSRSGLRPMEAQSQGQKSHYGITRKSEFLNHFWGTAARLLGPT